MQKSDKIKQQVILASYLKKLRLSRGLLQSELALLLGKPQSYVSKVETGERSLTIFEVEEIVGHLGQNLIDFSKRYWNYKNETQ